VQVDLKTRIFRGSLYAARQSEKHVLGEIFVCLLQGKTIIILLQKYSIFGYTTGIEQLRDPQANSKQKPFSALFNINYVAAQRHIINTTT